jgi:hypothetical protein
MIASFVSFWQTARGIVVAALAKKRPPKLRAAATKTGFVAACSSRAFRDEQGVRLPNEICPFHLSGLNRVPKL